MVHTKRRAYMSETMSKLQEAIRKTYHDRAFVAWASGCLALHRLMRCCYDLRRIRLANLAARATVDRRSLRSCLIFMRSYLVTERQSMKVFNRAWSIWLRSHRRNRQHRGFLRHRALHLSLKAWWAIIEARRMSKRRMLSRSIGGLWICVRSNRVNLFFTIWRIRGLESKRLSTQMVLRQCLRGLSRLTAVSLRLRRGCTQLERKNRVKVQRRYLLEIKQRAYVLVKIAQFRGRIVLTQVLRGWSVVVVHRNRLARRLRIGQMRSTKRIIGRHLNAFAVFGLALNIQSSIRNTYLAYVCEQWSLVVQTTKFKRTRRNIAENARVEYMKRKVVAFLCKWRFRSRVVSTVDCIRLRIRHSVKHLWEIWSRRIHPLLQLDMKKRALADQNAGKTRLKRSIFFLHRYAVRERTKRIYWETKKIALSTSQRQIFAPNCLELFRVNLAQSRSVKTLKFRLSLKGTLACMSEWLRVTVESVERSQHEKRVAITLAFRRLGIWSTRHRSSRKDLMRNLTIKFVSSWLQALEFAMRSNQFKQRVRLRCLGNSLRCLRDVLHAGRAMDLVRDQSLTGRAFEGFARWCRQKIHEGALTGNILEIRAKRWFAQFKSILEYSLLARESERARVVREEAAQRLREWDALEEERHKERLALTSHVWSIRRSFLRRWKNSRVAYPEEMLEGAPVWTPEKSCTDPPGREVDALERLCSKVNAIKANLRSLR